MRLLFFLLLTICNLSCDPNKETRPAPADTQAIMKEINEDLKLNREEYYLKIKDKRSIELKIKTNEQSKDSHGKEMLVNLKLNNLELEETSWGKNQSDPVHIKLELTDLILERIYNTIERMELNRSFTKEFTDSGNVKYLASLKIDNKEVIKLTGGRDLMNNEVAANLMLLADYLGNLANGEEDEFMQWTEKFMENIKKQ